MSPTEQTGIRELRQHASRWIAKAKAAAAIQITDRGEPLARLVPVDPGDKRRNALIADMLLIPAAQRRTALRVGELIPGPPLSTIRADLRCDR